MKKALSLKLLFTFFIATAYCRVMAQSVESFMSNGQEMLVRGAYSQAVNAFRQALAREPDFFEAQFNLGFAYLQWGNHSQAVTELKKALKLQPRNSEVWSNLAIAYENLGRINDAMAALDQAVTFNPENITARMNLAAMYSNANRAQQAIAQYKQVVRLDGSNGEALLNLAKCLKNTGAVAEAKNFLKQAVAAQPNKGEAHMELGDIYWKKENNIQKAMEEYRLAVTVEPSVPAFYESLATALENQRQTQEAIEIWKKALIYIDDALSKEKIQDRINRLETGSSPGTPGSSGDAGMTTTISKEQTRDLEREMRPDSRKETRRIETKPVDVSNDFSGFGSDTAADDSWDLKKAAKKRAQDKKTGQ